MELNCIGTIPTRAHDSDAGYDLRAIQKASIRPGATIMVPTGFAASVPQGYAGLVMSRSGMALKRSVFVLNAPGLIDPGYIGEICVILHNSGDEYFDINPGDKVAQLVFVKVEHPLFIKVESLDPTPRGEGGFGSTGAQ